MKRVSKKLFIDFFPLYDRLINDLKTGKKRLPNGNLYREGSIQTYVNVKKKLLQFIIDKKFYLRFRKVNSLTQRELIAEKNYWKKFYRKISDYLYNQCRHNDNYVG